MMVHLCGSCGLVASAELAMQFALRLSAPLLPN
jgi:hypothetical protein